MRSMRAIDRATTPRGSIDRESPVHVDWITHTRARARWVGVRDDDDDDDDDGATTTTARRRRRRSMYEPSVLKKSLQYSCDACGDLPILRKRWVCERCEDFDLCDACHGRQHKRPHHSSSSSESSSSDDDGRGKSGAMANHDATHEMKAYVVEDTLEPMTRGPLKECVLDATSRWYIETLRAAKNGDVAAAALASQMLTEGYGCNEDLDEAKYWHRVARSSGARRVDGVYDKLP